MCEPKLILTAVGGLLANQLMAPKQGSAPAPQAPAAPPQATKQPDQAAARAKPSSAGAPTSATMLTGAAGVDPASLALGKNTLLGA